MILDQIWNSRLTTQWTGLLSYRLPVRYKRRPPGHCWFPLHGVKMRQFVSLPPASSSQLSDISPQVSLLALAGVCLARPHVNSGVPAGPLTPAVGDLVATPKGYRSFALEGFSEDLDQDGFVPPRSPAQLDNLFLFKIR